jgi:CubicO group peptidase (beta-lactamase class C family)
MRTGRFPSFAAILCLTVLIGCGPAPSPTPQLRGDRFDPVRRLIGQRMRQHRIASLAIAVAQDGRIVWEGAYGWADKEKKIRATPRSVYALASITKLMTATGLMVLVERGQVDLDRPVNDYLGAAKLTACVGRAEGATIRRMLHFTAGLPMQVNLFFDDGSSRPPSMDESIRHYGIIVSVPGREYQYSNFAYGVLDQVIARVSAKSYAEFMQSEVFEPLGMTHTSVGIDSALRQDVVQNYSPDGSPVPRWETDHRGASAVYSSVHDLVRFGMFHLHDRLPDQKTILRDRTLDLAHEPDRLRMPGEGNSTTSAGFGCAVVDLEGYRFLVASGGAPGTVTRLALLPARDVAVAIVMNSGISESYSPWDIEWQAFGAVVQGFPRQPRIPSANVAGAQPQPQLVGEWTGTIRTDQGVLPTGLTIRSSRDLRLAVDGAVTVPIWQTNPLGNVGFRDGILEGPFFGRMPTPDARRAPHVLMLRLRLEGDTLRGSISAVATNRSFWLPYWIQLVRKRD